MEAERALQLCRRHGACARGGEQPELHGGEQDLRGPEAHADLHQAAGVALSHVSSLSS